MVWAEPTLLLVRLETPLFHLLCVVAYGPYIDHPKILPGEYWPHVACKVEKLRMKGDLTVVLTDANAHLHNQGDREREHAQHFRDAMAKIDVGICLLQDPLPTYRSQSGTVWQDDYLGTSGGITLDVASIEVPVIAQVAEGGFHEPITAEIQVTI